MMMVQCDFVFTAERRCALTFRPDKLPHTHSLEVPALGASK
jgi:hypothetical protein